MCDRVSRDAMNTQSDTISGEIHTWLVIIMFYLVRNFEWRWKNVIMIRRRSHSLFLLPSLPGAWEG